jgi:acetyl esterase
MEEAVDAECGPALPLPVVVDVDADGVPCRLYATRADAPLFVYLHGGGWCYGSIETVDRVCRRIADRSGCAVLSVDYRLAPEHVFPAALDDVETVLAIVREGADWASTRPGWRSAATAPAASWPPSPPGGSGTPPPRWTTRC